MRFTSRVSVPLLWLQLLQWRPHALDARVGKDDVEATPAFYKPFDCMPHLVRLGNIGDQWHSFAGMIRDPVDHILKLFVVAAKRAHLRAFPCEQIGCRSSDP